MLGDVLGAVEETFRNYIEEEAGEQGGADEVAAGDDALGELPAGVLLEPVVLDAGGMGGVGRQLPRLAFDDGCACHRFVILLTWGPETEWGCVSR